ncbi:AraC family transcriptional regulator [Tistrella mobilis]|uniref:AraC family transcriptional regulator n=1 Tax=Tistrella mobilis TaxID=171437 RepID=UPI0031F6515D
MSDPAQGYAGLTDGVRLVAAGTTGVEATFARLRRHRFRPHTHDTLMLGLIEAGVKEFRRERTTHAAAPGRISVVDPGDLHTGSRVVGDELRYRALYLPMALLTEAAAAAGFGPGGGVAGGDAPEVGFRSAVIEDAGLHARLIATHQALCRPETRLARDVLLREAAVMLVARHGSGRAARRVATAATPEIARARALIEARFAEDLPVAEIAAAAGLSPWHLMRQFRRLVGLPIHAYQIQLRVEAAKRLLAAGCPTVQAALETGFADQAHFSRRFKDLVGVSPAAWARDRRGATGA